MKRFTFLKISPDIVSGTIAAIKTISEVCSSEFMPVDVKSLNMMSSHSDLK